MSRRRLRRAVPGWVAVAALLAPVAPAAADGVRFAEVAEEWGLAFRHHHGGSGERYMVETMVGGLVIFDYDGDGDPDVFFVDGASLPGYTGEPTGSRLYRNDGGGRFVDVTERSGIGDLGYGCGGAAADHDGDGDLDLYVTAFGANRLLVNRGDGTFEEAAAAAGVAEELWSAAAAFADADGDGDLDLYVTSYVDFTLETHKFCGEEKAGLQGYCHPGAYEGEPDRFYRNRGDGTFADATAEAGFSGAVEAGLGAIWSDVDVDGDLDLYVANDADPNFLFTNRGDGTFEDVSLLSGTAYSDGGSPEAGMGVDLGDVDGDGRLDIVVTNFELETNALYKNTGAALFVDHRFPSGIAEPSLLDLAFGVAFADLDHDADLDLVVANGHILDNAVEFNEASRYAQANLVMVNDGRGRFVEAADAGLELARVGRGLGAGDLDGDGDLDFVVSNSNDVAEVYENRTETAGGWLLVDLRAAGANRFAVGARLELTAAGRRQVREVRAGSSYLSQNALSVHFGTADAGVAEALEIRWPGGRRQRLERVPVERRIVVGGPGAPGGGTPSVATGLAGGDHPDAAELVAAPPSG